MLWQGLKKKFTSAPEKVQQNNCSFQKLSDLLKPEQFDSSR